MTICPKCKSRKVKEIFFIPIFNDYKCKSCGYKFSNEIIDRVCVLCDEKAIGTTLCIKCELLMDKFEDEGSDVLEYIFKHGIDNGVAWYKRARNIIINETAWKHEETKRKEAVKLMLKNKKLKAQVDKMMWEKKC